MLIALILAQALVPADPAGPIFTNPAAMWSPAFFEAFPANGRGTTTACSTTAPTGAKGEALTFTRASSATCTKTATGGLATTGIANGDLVVLTSNQPRVEYDSAGTLGLLVESSRTNSVLRSAELGNAVWSLSSSGAGLPTRTATYANGPDGTLSATRLEVPATTAVQFSGVTQGITIASGTTSWSVYLKGTSTSGTTDLCVGVGPYTCAACAFVASSWTRCTVSGSTAINPGLYVGNMSSVNGGTARSAVDVLVWGAQGETGAYATSYIPTTSAAVTRATESARFAGVAVGNTFSISARTSGPLSGFRYLLNLYVSGADRWALYTNSSNLAFERNGGGGVTRASSVSAVSAGWYDGATENVCVNGTCSSAAYTTGGISTSWDVYLGLYGGAAGFEADGVVSRICIDLPTRCR